MPTNPTHIEYDVVSINSPAAVDDRTESDSDESVAASSLSSRQETHGSAKLSKNPPSSDHQPTLASAMGIGDIQTWICAISAFSGFLFGYDLCVMVIALPLIQRDFDLSTGYAESVISTLMLGAVFGSLGGGILADWIGRKKANLITAALFLLGSVCMTFCGSVATLLLGRFIAGVAVGSSGPCVSVYVAEIAHPDIRGALVTINEVMVCFGCLVSVGVGSSLQNAEDGWRKILAMTILPPIIQLVGLPFLPESPRWLLSQYRTKEAAVVLKRLLYTEEASQDIIKAHVNGTQSLWSTVREAIGDEITRRRVLFCMAIAFCHILTGANAMLYYSTYIMDGLHAYDSREPSELSKEIWIGVAKLAGVCSAILVVDRVGRRPLLLLGTSLMLASHFLFAVCFWLLEPSRADIVESIGEWNLYVFIFMWNLSWSPLMWVVCSEVLPDEFRSMGMGLTFAVFWMGSALVNQTLLTVFDAIGTAPTFLMYTLLTLGVLVFVCAKVPETMGLSFEQIAELFTTRPRLQVEHRIFDPRADHIAL